MQLSFVQKKNCRLIHKFLIKISNGITMHLTRALYQLYTDVRSKAAMRPKTKNETNKRRRRKKKQPKWNTLSDHYHWNEMKIKLNEREKWRAYIYICYIIIYKCVNPYRVIRHTHTMWTQQMSQRSKRKILIKKKKAQNNAEKQKHLTHTCDVCILYCMHASIITNTIYIYQYTI